MLYINDHTDALDIEEALAQVSPQRREQALRFRHEGGRRLCLAAYLLLMDGLRQEYGILEPPVFGYSADGKPFISSHPDIHFNFSHSGNVALCVLDRQPVGADVEVPRKITPSLVSYTMNDQEQQWIAADPDPVAAFLHLWTRKEAVLKLTGEGIRNDLKTVLDDTGKFLMETVRADHCIYSIARYADNPKTSI